MKSHFYFTIAILIFFILRINSTLVAADSVYSFKIQGTASSGDIPTTAGNNANGLSITGQVGNWALITTAANTATDDGVTLTFDAANSSGEWGNTTGARSFFSGAIRIGTFLTAERDLNWTLSGLTPDAYYDMIWYNKGTPDNRAPNTGVDGFDAGNGIGVSGPHDADKDQNFESVRANSSGEITGTWFLSGGLEDITAVAGVQVKQGLNPDGQVSLSANTLVGNSPIGTFVGNLSYNLSDVNTDYSLGLSGDNLHFQILKTSDNLISSLRTNATLSSGNYYNITISANSNSGNTTSSNLIIGTSIPTTPLIIVSADIGTSISGNTEIASLSIAGNDTVTYAVTDGRTDLIAIYNNKLVAKIGSESSWGPKGSVYYATLVATIAGGSSSVIVKVEIKNAATGTIIIFN